MRLQTHIGFIGGGQMAEALIKGIVQSELVDPEQILVTDPDASRQSLLKDSYGVNAFDEPEPVWSKCDIVILAVKPQIVQEVLQTSQHMMRDTHLIISIAAGIPLAALEKHANSGARLIRVMPNTPALVQEAASALSRGTLATEDDMAIAAAIFDSIGKTVILEEKYLDAVTGLSGSGPAYVFSFIEALIDAGLKVGLNRGVAETLVLQTILGSTKLAMTSDIHPAQLRAMVTSPGGTTIAGLHKLEKAGFRGIVMDAVETATNRSRELGK